MGDTKGALDDAEEALNNDPNFVKGEFHHLNWSDDDVFGIYTSEKNESPF